MSQPQTLREQSNMVREFVSRCEYRDGSVAEWTSLRVSREDAERLRVLADRLERMAIYERQIKKMVTGR